MKRLLPLAVFGILALVLVSGAHAVVLEGVGHANIHNGNLEAARAEARKAAIRDLSLQHEARAEPGTCG